MKFRCERDSLAEAVSNAARAVSHRGTTMPALSGVHLVLSGEQLLLTGTDLDLAVQTSLMVAGVQDGEAVVSAKLLSDVIKALPQGTVTFEVEGVDARVQVNRSQFSLRVLNAEEFPKVSIPGEFTVELQGNQLSTVLRQIVRAASHDESRPVLTGVLLSAEDDGLRLVATDSYRLAVGDVPGAKVLLAGQSVLIPSRALGELARLLVESQPVSLRLDERDATFRVGETVLNTRLIEGQFPDYRPLLPSGYPNRLMVDRDVFIESLRRVKLLVRDVTTPVRVSLSTESVDLTVISQDVGQASETIEGKYEGEPMTVAFNPAYLIDGLEAMPAGEVVLETLDALKPATLTPQGDTGFLYLIMPVRVS